MAIRNDKQMQPRRVSQHIGLAVAAAAGWQVRVQPPPARCVIVGAPHTSNWDLALTLLLMLAGGLKLRWVGKEALFRGPMGWMMRTLGGMHVKRGGRKKLVEQMAA